MKIDYELWRGNKLHFLTVEFSIENYNGSRDDPPYTDIILDSVLLNGRDVEKFLTDAELLDIESECWSQRYDQR